MRKLQADGKAGMGGRRPVHGIRALAERLRRGLDPDTPLAALHAELRGRYVADLGGEDTISNMEAGICDRLADLDLMRGLLNAQRETARRMTAKKLLDHVASVTKNALGYVQLAKAVGPGRRAKPTDKTVLVRRFSAEPSRGTDNGQDEANVREPLGQEKQG